MSKVISSLTPDNQSNAGFRAYGLGISTALQSLLTLVAQTGQINWSTVTAPSSNGDIRGFEVYRFNDTLQATAPIFIKVEYGSTTIQRERPVLKMTVGKSVNGSGTIGDVLLPATEVIQAGNIPNAVPSNCYFGNGDGSCLVISLWPTEAAFQTQGSYLALERSRDVSGAATGDAVWWQFSGATATDGDINQSTDYVAGTVNTLAYGAVPVLYPLTANVSLSNGVSTPVFTGSVITAQRVSWVPTALMCCAQADLGTGTVASALVAGIDYLSTGAGGQWADTGRQQYAVALLRWD